jgi:hypothetical protein
MSAEPRLEVEMMRRTLIAPNRPRSASSVMPRVMAWVTRSEAS